MERKIIIYTNNLKHFDEIQSKYTALNNCEKLNCINTEPQQSTFAQNCYSFYSWKNPAHTYSSIRFNEKNYSVADTYTEEEIINEFADMAAEKSIPCVIEYSASSDEDPFLSNYNKKNNDISGIYSAIRISAPAKEVITAYNDILNMFANEPKLLTNILTGFTGNDFIEIRYEFKGEPDFEVLLKDFLKKHPNIRVLSVTTAKKWTDQTILYSGSGTHKFKTKNIRFERSWDNDYDHLSSKFSLWGDPQLNDQDFYFKENGNNCILSWVNDFNWNEKIDLSLFSKNITTIGKKAFSNNKYIKEIILPASLKKIEKEAFAKCPNLKHIYFNSEPDFEVGVFDDCKKLTVHAKSGGKVNLYAQQNTIPFVEK